MVHDADNVVRATVHNEERLPVEIILKVLTHASLATIISFKTTSRYWNSVQLDLPPITARLLRCWELSCFLTKHGWRGTSPGVKGIWEIDATSRQSWVHRFDNHVQCSDIVARLPESFVRFMQELPAPTNPSVFQEYLRHKRPSLPPSPPKTNIPFLHDFPMQLEGMFLLNHPAWY